MKRFPLLKHFNWRALLVRILINAAVLTVTALILPNVSFVQITIGNILFVAIALGILNALIKPILQFLTLSFIFTTYGLVVVLINAVILWLLSFLFPDRFAVDSILAALIGGALIGILGSFFESLFGLSPPIIPDVEDDESQLRKADPTPVVTKMILKKGQGEEPKLADPAAPLVAGQKDSLSDEAPEQPEDEGVLAKPVDQVSQLPPPDARPKTEEPDERAMVDDAPAAEEKPDEQVIVDDAPSAEEEPDGQVMVDDAPVEEEEPSVLDTETLNLPTETSASAQNNAPAPTEENESWQ